MVKKYLNANASNAQHIVKLAIKYIHREKPMSYAHTALKDAILTPKDKISEDTKEKLYCILQDYI